MLISVCCHQGPSGRNRDVENVRACAQNSACAEATGFRSVSGFRSDATVLSVTYILPVKGDPTIFDPCVPIFRAFICATEVLNLCTVLQEARLLIRLSRICVWVVKSAF